MSLAPGTTLCRDTIIFHLPLTNTDTETESQSLNKFDQGHGGAGNLSSGSLTHREL